MVVVRTHRRHAGVLRGVALAGRALLAGGAGVAAAAVAHADGGRVPICLSANAEWEMRNLNVERERCGKEGRGGARSCAVECGGDRGGRTLIYRVSEGRTSSLFCVSPTREKLE